jgi:hypothetical protein
MSESIGNPVSRGAGLTPPSATATTTERSTGAGPTARGSSTVDEAYSFACLSCGYGWEQEYLIEHVTDRDGHVNVYYHANGVRVPSPLLKPTCPGCGGHTVRIMGAGRVAAVGKHWERNPSAPGPHPAPRPGQPLDEPPTPGRGLHLHLPFHLHLHLPLPLWHSHRAP